MPDQPKHYSIIEKSALGVAYDGDGPLIYYQCDGIEYLHEVPTDEGRPGSRVYVKVSGGYIPYMLGSDHTWGSMGGPNGIDKDINYCAELPPSGVEGYTYITPLGVFHYENGEFVPVATNGFKMTRGSSNEVIMSFTDPSTEESATSVTMAKNSTMASIVTQFSNIANNLAVIAAEVE